ncbi:NUDIX hydrolase [Nesterenkonia populi]
MSREETVYTWDGPPRISLTRRDVSLPSGRTYLAHQLNGGDGTGVVIIGRCGQSLLFVESLRPLVDAAVLELPRGFADAAESTPEETAAREFLEETGLELHSPTEIGRYWTDTGIYPAEVAVITGQCDADAAPATTDGETIRTRWIPKSDIPHLIQTGQLRDAHTLSSLTLWQTSRRRFLPAEEFTAHKYPRAGFNPDALRDELDAATATEPRDPYA